MLHNQFCLTQLYVNHFSVPHILECTFCCSPYYEYFVNDYDADDDDGNLIKELLKFYVRYVQMCVYV